MSLSVGGLVVTDTYPDRARMQSVYVMDGDSVTRLARVFSPFKFDGDVRCDLHPRFDRLGSRIMVDATFEGRRAMYELPARAAAPAPKVLTVVTVPMAFDGPTMSMLRYARAMDPARVHIDYVAINDPPDEIKGEILGMGGKLITIGGRMRNPFAYVLKLARVVRRGKYQVVHARGNSCTLALEMLAAFLGGAKVRVAHSENSYCKFLTAHRLLRPLFDLLYTDAYACGAEAGNWLFRSRPFRVARISVEPEKYLFDPAAREKHRRALGVGDELLIGCVAHFTPHKNHAFLIDMFADYLHINPAARLALVGDGALRQEVEKRIAALGIEKSVLLLGVRTDVPALLSAFDAMLLTSLWEGFPNVLVEWQCAGLAALVSDKVTRDAKLTGLVSYLPIDSEAPWLEVLSRFAPPTNRKRVSEDAIAAVREAGYDIRENARGLQDFYLEAARRCPR
jgi:glycosyltransferase involved in cell wall biosynthesis